MASVLIDLIESPMTASTPQCIRTRGFEHVGPVFLKMWRAASSILLRQDDLATGPATSAHRPNDLGKAVEGIAS